MPSPSVESVVTFLFKYPPRVFQRGDVVWAPVIPVAVVALVAVAAIATVVWTYARVRGVTRTDRSVLTAVRVAAVALVLACLLRPTIVLSSAVKQRNVLAVLLDDSRSMRLKDVDGASRLSAVQRVFGDTTSLMHKLSDRFAVRVFRFSADAAAIPDANTLTAVGGRTDLARALDATREDLAGMPVAGVVVVSDGADNGGSDLGTALLALRSRRVPVYTVGVGEERFAHDVAIERVTVPASVLAGSTILLDAAIGVRGAKGEKTTITAEANGRRVASEEITLPDAGDVARVRLRIPPMAPGTYRLVFRVAPLKDEAVIENNEYHTMLDVRGGPARILYVEGEPRPEFAFIRRAVADDSSLQVVGLLRSAEHKYLRLGVADSMELVSGFPTKREDLFRYRAIIIGSVEASYFSGDQLRMLAEFVSQRGGGLLALGGRSSFSEGGYADTPVAEVLPVRVERARFDTGAPPAYVKVRPTPAGSLNAALQLRNSDAASAARWDSLPQLTIVNMPGPLRAGSTVLLNGRIADKTAGALEVPVLAFQRYGRGMGAVFTAQDSWLWQMDPTTPSSDQTYATFWRQVMRWLVDGVPERVEVSATPVRAGPGEPVTFRARVVDSIYRPINGASVTTKVTSPTGRRSTVPMEWSLREDGSYSGHFTTVEAGVYSLEAHVTGGRDTARSLPSPLLADDQGSDVEQAEQRAALLKRISRETGGKYYGISNVSALPDDAVFTEGGVTVRESRDLWDMPIVFLLLALLLGSEWMYRRRRGLA